MTYAEKLKDPRWQKKRLTVLDKANWICKFCKDGKTSLHVHHKKYTGNPWDASDDDLVAVCADCHLIIEYIKKQTGDKLVVEKIFKRRTGENDAEKRFFCVVTNLSSNKKELIIVKVFEEQIVDGIWLNHDTIEEIIYEFI